MLLYHVNRIGTILKQLFDYRPVGRRSGQPLERLLDGYVHEA